MRPRLAREAPTQVVLDLTPGYRIVWSQESDDLPAPSHATGSSSPMREKLGGFGKLVVDDL